MLLAKFQHTATRRWLPHGKVGLVNKLEWFQHTATRRWLPLDYAKSSKNLQVSTHSHPKVAAQWQNSSLQIGCLFQHTATRRWLQEPEKGKKEKKEFQHTATRRWLPKQESRTLRWLRFNTQPPEGGCVLSLSLMRKIQRFQHTATRRWLLEKAFTYVKDMAFQHTATRRWLPMTKLYQFYF